MQFAKKRILFYQNPFSRQLLTHKLKGDLKNYWSFSITFSYRVLFQFVKKDVVLFHDIGDHQIYQ
jgi:mRNA-degrading endonuclease YafQ of YafQ-DinJ toxin-antitoxin module